MNEFMMKKLRGRVGGAKEISSGRPWVEKVNNDVFLIVCINCIFIVLLIM
jgi:hypothetical protein